MLAGLVTGYEGRFDFPRRTSPPTLTYLLATLPRTGSTWFSHLLWQTGCLGAPLEYLNFEPTGPYYFAARSTASQQQLWHSLMSRRTSPNGLFGLKCFPDQLESLQQENPQLLSDVMSTFVTGTPTPRMEPGSVGAVPLLVGDMDLPAIGTATEVLGGKVYGFGHPFNNEGKVTLPMGPGSINHIVATLREASLSGASVDWSPPQPERKRTPPRIATPRTAPVFPAAEAGKRGQACPFEPGPRPRSADGPLGVSLRRRRRRPLG
jgi:hypothetical protein